MTTLSGRQCRLLKPRHTKIVTREQTFMKAAKGCLLSLSYKSLSTDHAAVAYLPRLQVAEGH